MVAKNYVLVCSNLALPLGPEVVPFYGLYLEFPKKNYLGAYGYTLNISASQGSPLHDCRRELCSSNFSVAPCLPG